MRRSHGGEIGLSLYTDFTPLSSVSWGMSHAFGRSIAGRVGLQELVARDVRHGSIKRVPSAVDEDSIAIGLEHQYLDRF